jgi:hypothetical protein
MNEIQQAVSRNENNHGANKLPACEQRPVIALY